MTTARARFAEQLAEQRWDDHRLYHHSRINQSLHFVSALSFIAAYAFLACGWVASRIRHDPCAGAYR